MPYAAILQRALAITCRHRVLYLAGVAPLLVSAGLLLIDVLALPATTVEPPSLASSAWWRAVYARPAPIPAWVTLAVLLWGILAFITYLVSEGTLIHMVDEIEGTGTADLRVGLQAGWRHWPRLAGITLAMLGAPVLLTLLAITPVMLGQQRQIGLSQAIYCLLLPIFLCILGAAIAMLMFTPLMYRRCALRHEGPFEAIRQGYRLVRRHLGPVLLIVLLLLVADRVVWVALVPIAMTGAFTLAGLIPTLRVVAALLAVGSACCLYGLLAVFQSAVWTLAYREMATQQRVERCSGKRRRIARAGG